MNKKAKALTLTILANMTSNYGEGLGNISTVQKIFKNGKIYASRSKESLKNSIMVQSGMYDDIQVVVDGATQKNVSEEFNVSNCRALEGGYMNTSSDTYIRKSSFYVTDAVACYEFINETRFHNNLYLANTFAKQNNFNLQNDAGKCGLMPYQYEYDKSIKCYSITIDLELIGIDNNFNKECENKEKADRVNLILDAVENLNLIVKGNLDNAEPIFAIGGLSDRKTHYFENVVKAKDGKLCISNELVDRLNRGFNAAFIEGENFQNEKEIVERLNPMTITGFFGNLKKQVNDYYGV